VWKLASRRRACIIGFALIPLGLRLALLPWIPAPQPAVHDEFSNLLAGDTFASGRLTNPPHRYWVFFESFHILQQPTYMSKYPPLTGFILGLGQRIFSHPWAGVVLSMGLLCGCLAWAAGNWLPPFWALIGTALAVLKIGILSYWSESYWGGTGAAIGGTLLIGSLPAMIHRPSARSSIPAGIGIALLANSRPFEGLVLALLCLGYAAWSIIRRGPAASDWLRDLSRGIVAPLVIVLVPAGAWMAYYNQRVTGNALVLPYVAHERQYAAASDFPWDKPGPAPVYRHEVLRQFWLGWEVEKKTFQREHFLLTRLPSFASVEEFYLGVPLFILLLACAPAVVKCRRTRSASWILALFLAGLGLELQFLPHYAAPATALFFIAAAGALRVLRHWQPKPAWMGSAVYGTALAVVTVSLLAGAFQPSHRFLYDKGEFLAERARILEFLRRAPGKQLVFVRYGPEHSVHNEWVYNRADIDGSRVVWARSMGPEKDEALIAYFKDRRVWVVDDNGPAQISPYAPTDVR